MGERPDRYIPFTYGKKRKRKLMVEQCIQAGKVLPLWNKGIQTGFRASIVPHAEGSRAAQRKKKNRRGTLILPCSYKGGEKH